MAWSPPLPNAMSIPANADLYISYSVEPSFDIDILNVICNPASNFISFTASSI